MHELIEAYRKGAITAQHLAVQSLHMIDPKEPSLVLSHLPDEILVAMENFAARYDSECMLTNYGVIPVQDQVDAAIQWIQEKEHNSQTSG